MEEIYKLFRIFDEECHRILTFRHVRFDSWDVDAFLKTIDIIETATKGLREATIAMRDANTQGEE